MRLGLSLPTPAAEKGPLLYVFGGSGEGDSDPSDTPHALVHSTNSWGSMDYRVPVF